MINLRFLLLLSLVSFSLQDKYCLATYELYSPKNSGTGITTQQITIPHCVNQEDDKCLACGHNYLVSSDFSKCVYVSN